MNEQLIRMIEQVKNELARNPNAILFGDVHDGNKKITPTDVCNHAYFEFLKQVDGGRFGIIDFWSFNDLPNHQFRMNGQINGTEIGQLLYEPLILENLSGHVLYSRHDGVQDLGSFNDFLSTFVFGVRYAELAPEPHVDEWFQFLKRIAFI